MTANLLKPGKLFQNISATYGEAGRKWIQDLPVLVRQLAEQWQLEHLVEFENLSWNYVAKGLQSGHRVVLKVSCDLPSLKREVNALKVFTAGSCVEVIQFDEEKKAILLEAAYPGDDLLKNKQNLGSFEVLEICCNAARNLQLKQNPFKFPFDRIRDLLKNVDKEWAIPEKMLITARRFKKDFPIEKDVYLIHGDLHRENILSHEYEWRVIDPKGYLGTLYNEVWPFVHEPEIEIPWIAKRLNLNEDQLTKWCFVHSILSTTWGLEDGIDTKNIFGLAEKLYRLL